MYNAIVSLVVCLPTSVLGYHSAEEYVLRLTADEFAVLYSAASAGAAAGDVSWNCNLSLQPQGADVPSLTVTLDNLVTLNAMSHWMATKANELINVVDFDSMSDDAKHAFKVVQAVNRKITDASSNPIYPIESLAGTLRATPQPTEVDASADVPAVALSLDDWHDLAPNWMLSITGPLASDLASERWHGKPAILVGYIKSPGSMEVIKAIEHKRDTVEVFTMSECPFGRQALTSILSHVDAIAARGQPAPTVEVRYIFYTTQSVPAPEEGKSPSAGAPAWYCMHGESELRENLVQMAIRDHFADRFVPYLRSRLTASDGPWEQVAATAGLDVEAQRFIAGLIQADRDAMIRAEHNYVAGLHGVVDGSPTWVWESRVVPDIRRVRAFKDLDMSGGSCAGHTVPAEAAPQTTAPQGAVGATGSP